MLVLIGVHRGTIYDTLATAGHHETSSLMINAKHLKDTAPKNLDFLQQGLMRYYT